MSEPFLPWWLVLLLGMWATALALWRHPSVPRELCWWSGLAALIYSLLILLALTPANRPDGSSAALAAIDHSVRWGIVACAVVILSAGLWHVGRTTAAARRLAYGILTVGNAGCCALLGAPELACGLIVIAFTAFPLSWLRRLKTGLLGVRESIQQAFQLSPPPAGSDRRDETLLTAVLSHVLACLLIGTIAFSLRVEASRIATSPRYSTMPIRYVNDRVQSSVDDNRHRDSVLQVVVGSRPEILVLLAVIAFITLANTRSELMASNNSIPKNSDAAQGNQLP